MKRKLLVFEQEFQNTLPRQKMEESLFHRIANYPSVNQEFFNCFENDEYAKLFYVDKQAFQDLPENIESIICRSITQIPRRVYKKLKKLTITRPRLNERIQILTRYFPILKQLDASRLNCCKSIRIEPELTKLSLQLSEHDCPIPYIVNISLHISSQKHLKTLNLMLCPSTWLVVLAYHLQSASLQSVSVAGFFHSNFYDFLELQKNLEYVNINGNSNIRLKSDKLKELIVASNPYKVQVQSVESLEKLQLKYVGSFIVDNQFNACIYQSLRVLECSFSDTTFLASFLLLINASLFPVLQSLSLSGYYQASKSIISCKDILLHDFSYLEDVGMFNLSQSVQIHNMPMLHTLDLCKFSRLSLSESSIFAVQNCPKLQTIYFNPRFIENIENNNIPWHQLHTVLIDATELETPNQMDTFTRLYRQMPRLCQLTLCGGLHPKIISLVLEAIKSFKINRLIFKNCNFLDPFALIDLPFVKDLKLINIRFKNLRIFSLDSMHSLSVETRDNYSESYIQIKSNHLLKNIYLRNKDNKIYPSLICDLIDLPLLSVFNVKNFNLKVS